MRSAIAARRDSQTTCGALHALEELAENGNQNAISAAIARLEDGNREVRSVALQALSRVAGKGDQQAITAVVSRLEDVDIDVRRVALLALTQVAENIPGMSDLVARAHLRHGHVEAAERARPHTFKELCGPDGAWTQAAELVPGGNLLAAALHEVTGHHEEAQRALQALLRLPARCHAWDTETKGLDVRRDSH